MIALLIIVFLFTRLIKLKSFMPLFMDEALYIRWLSTIKATGEWLLPLKEFGWAPLTIWLSTLLSYLIKDNLLSLRITAAIFGGLTIIITFKLIKQLYSSSAAIITAAILLSSPVILIHDRLGLRGDSAVTFASILLLYGLVKRLIKNQAKAAYIIGLSIAFGLLIKSTAWTFPIITLSAYLIFRPKIKKADWFGGLIAGSSLLFYLFTNSLSAFLNKTNVFLSIPNQLIGFPKNNLIQTAIWSYQYLSPPVLILIFLGAYLTFKNNKKIWALLTAAILPVLIFDILFAKIFFPRYLLFIAVYSLFFAGFALSYISEKLPKYLSILIIILVFLPNLILDTAIIKDIKTAKLPEIERWQYITGWPSGYGLPELASYLQSDSPNVLITENNNLIRGGLPYYWHNHPFQIINLAEDNTTDFKPQSSQTTYLVLNILETLPDQFQGELVKQFPRPENKTSLKLYKITGIK